MADAEIQRRYVEHVTSSIKDLREDDARCKRFFAKQLDEIMLAGVRSLASAQADIPPVPASRTVKPRVSPETMEMAETQLRSREHDR